jgi:hypothetical protein
MDRNRQGKSLACAEWRSSIIRSSCAGVSFSCTGWAGRSSPCFQKVCSQSVRTHKILTLSTERKHPISVEIPTRGFWQPFLQQIQTLHPSFSSVLVRILIDELTLSEDNGAENNRPTGRFFCLAGWLLWVSTNWVQFPECDPTAIVEQLLLRVWQPK